MKFDRRSIGVKLMRYFALFALMVLGLLWLLQTVFLQSFYAGMKTRDIEAVAESLSQAYADQGFEAAADSAAYQNSILVYLTDLSGVLIYTTDEHGARKPQRKGIIPRNAGQDGFKRPLPEGYDEFLMALTQSDTGRVSYIQGQEEDEWKTLVCGVLLDDAVLYISTPLDSVGATISILRTQLLYVTAVSLLLGLLIAFFIARRFTKPVAAITKQAGELARGEFPESFDKGFCIELDELSDTLTYASAELKKVEKLRQELIANISHDLRTPLTMIKAYTEMIRDISGDNKQKREKHLAVISGEADHLTTLVDDILALSQIQSGNEALEMENLNLSDAVKKVLSRFDPIFAHEGYHLQLAVEPDQYVQADARKIEQVLYNLVGNAMNYAGEDKVLAVRVINLGSAVRVELADHGAGIPEDEIGHIWERYYRAKTHVRDASGTGLGLSIVKGILEMHDARFGVDSHVGAGSIFWFELKK